MTFGKMVSAQYRLTESVLFGSKHPNKVLITASCKTLGRIFDPSTSNSSL